MNITNITLSQAVRFMKLQAPRGGNVYILRIVRGLEERYGFLRSPRSIDEYNFANGVTFEQGDFLGQFSIDRFQVYENGLLAQAKVTTDALDELLDDVINWAMAELRINVDNPSGTMRGYISNLEFQCNLQIYEKFSQFTEVGKMLSTYVRGYGYNVSDYGVSGISMNY